MNQWDTLMTEQPHIIDNWGMYYLEDRWAFRRRPKISEMDTQWIRNSKKMIEDGRARVCAEPVLAKAYVERFELELKRRGF